MREQSIVHDTFMALSPDNRLLVVGNRQYIHTTFPFHLGISQSGTSVACHHLSEGAKPLAFQPNGDLFAWADGEGIGINQYKDGKMQRGNITHFFERGVSIGGRFRCNNKYGVLCGNEFLWWDNCPV